MRSAEPLLIAFGKFANGSGPLTFHIAFGRNAGVPPPIITMGYPNMKDGRLGSDQRQGLAWVAPAQPVCRRRLAI